MYINFFKRAIDIILSFIGIVVLATDAYCCDNYKA